VSNYITNQFRKKKVGVTVEKMGIRPQKPGRSNLDLSTNPLRNQKVVALLEKMGI